ncbi:MULTISPECIES: sensor histidine kinase [Glycomyces]|uniref:histidine kinase n=2 Tax=Glycomyces TaxID=58113 RepID=A0A9X3SWN6_9ACTN|nr:histidine kinase [Glycomyces lechevalierae]MDA1387449.1 histidine kinase [Glycomyces lechevalierae]MDR7338625.1 signal transduction histidine kinase [Glycomyces lechevalierae]
MTTTPASRALPNRVNRTLMLLLKIAIIGTLLLTLASEVLSSTPGERPPIVSWVSWVQLAVSLFVIGVYVFYRPGRKRWIAAASIASLVTTGFDMLYEQGVRGVGTAELLALGLLMLFSVRHWDASPGRWVAFANGAAVMLIGFRVFAQDFASAAIGGSVMIFMAMMTMIGFGAYLRSLDRLRRETQEEVRQAERLELAREMHDFVAHHVTGMVVLAQAAQVTNTDPKQAFADIEEAGLAALTSMRRMVKMLRNDDGGAGTNPLGDLAQIEDLVERFNREGTDATCFISPELAGSSVAPEIAATAHRIVREALTNVRKHARGATRVRVVVAAASGNGLEVSVRDDGRAARGRLAESGAGMGLLGLGERIEAVGGQLRAQTRPEGGWETAAWLPRAAPEAR